MKLSSFTEKNHYIASENTTATSFQVSCFHSVNLTFINDFQFFNYMKFF